MKAVAGTKFLLSAESTKPMPKSFVLEKRIKKIDDLICQFLHWKIIDAIIDTIIDANDTKQVG